MARIVADIPSPFGCGDTVFYDPWHYVLVLARKPGALRNGAPFKDWCCRAAMERVRRTVRDDPPFMARLRARVLQGRREKRSIVVPFQFTDDFVQSSGSTAFLVVRTVTTTRLPSGDAPPDHPLIVILERVQSPRSNSRGGSVGQSRAGIRPCLPGREARFAHPKCERSGIRQCYHARTVGRRTPRRSVCL